MSYPANLMNPFELHRRLKLISSSVGFSLKRLGEGMRPRGLEEETQCPPRGRRSSCCRKGPEKETPLHPQEDTEWVDFAKNQRRYDFGGEFGLLTGELLSYVAILMSTTHSHIRASTALLTLSMSLRPLWPTEREAL